jgi:hypothetical protein
VTNQQSGMFIRKMKLLSLSTIREVGLALMPLKLMVKYSKVRKTWPILLMADGVIRFTWLILRIRMIRCVYSKRHPILRIVI